MSREGKKRIIIKIVIYDPVGEGKGTKRWEGRGSDVG